MVEHRPVDMKAVRIKIGLSQSVFSPTQGLSAAPLRDWEQQRQDAGTDSPPPARGGHAGAEIKVGDVPANLVPRKIRRIERVAGQADKTGFGIERRGDRLQGYGPRIGLQLRRIDLVEQFGGGRPRPGDLHERKTGGACGPPGLRILRENARGGVTLTRTL